MSRFSIPKTVSPAAKLTLAYVGLLLVLSILFSSIVYSLAERQLEDGLRRQYMQLQREFPGPSGNGGQGFINSEINLDEFRTGLEDAKRELLIELIYFNLGIIVMGSGASYFLARKTMRPIELALDAQSRFAADASHELRTPLAVMQTEIEIARADPNLTKGEALELLDSNLEEVARLHALANGLLALARNDNSSLPMDNVRLDNIIHDAISRVQSLPESTGNITTNVEELYVYANKQSITEVLIILIDNAIKYGGSDVEIAIDVKTVHSSIHISVSDNGPGIAQEDMGRVFERFYRADQSRSTTVAGHGLGLAIASEIIGAHDSRINITSNTPHGAVFSFNLKGKRADKS